MTLIECFDRTILENIAGTLCVCPDKLVILGDAKKAKPTLPLYSNLLRGRSMPTQIELCDTAGMTIQQIAAELTGMIQPQEQYVIDLTGGEEATVLAVGAMLASLENTRNISVQKFDPLTGTAIDCDGDGLTVDGRCAALTAGELIALHGGIVHPVSAQPAAHYGPGDIEKLWEIVAEAPRDWNSRISILSEFEKRSESKEELEMSRSQLAAEIRDFSQKERVFQTLMDQFCAKGIIHDKSSYSTIRYRYTSDLYRTCTKKAGNVLELKVLLEARAMEEQDEPYFDDCVMGLNIDWDGITQDKTSNLPETRNEVDVVLTRGLCSLFISCKNGFIDEAELYKLHTVAQCFGGPWARKMLIATDLDQKTPPATQAFIQRAKDMGVYLITDAAQLEPSQWQEILRTAMA